MSGELETVTIERKHFSCLSPRILNPAVISDFQFSATVNLIKFESNLSLKKF